MTKNILIKNIYYMMAYAFDTLNFSQYQSVESEDFDFIDDLFASILTIAMNTQIKKGLARNYISFNEDLKVLRGKVDISSSLKTNSLMKKELSCQFDEYSENNLLNSIVKSTLFMLLRREDVKKKTKNEIKRILLYLSNVDCIDLRTLNFKRVNIPRHQKDYRIMVYIAYLYQKAKIFANEEAYLNIETISNSNEIHSLFENFVLRYYQVHHKSLRAKGCLIPWDSENIHGLLPVMKTDINLYGKQTTLIIDTKFYSSMYGYSYSVQRLLSNNIYQMYSYLSNYQSENELNPIGMLLYAETAKEAPLDVKENINGYDIYFKSINLNTKFEEISDFLDSLVGLID